MDLIESYAQDLQLMRKTWTKVWVMGVIVTLAMLPWFASEHAVYLATLVAMYTIGVQGQNLLIGYTGQISFGQAGFLCVGAYSFGHLSRMGVPWPLALPAAGLITALFGVVVGFPSLRLKGPYLAVATLGFGIAVYQIFVNSTLLSGGRMGLAVTKLSPLWGLSSVNLSYYLNFGVALLFTLATYNIVSSYLGRAFVAIRDNDIAAEIMGVDLARYKLLVFAVSSFYLGVQAGLYALLLGYLEPNMFTFSETITFLVAGIVGGLASVEGAMLGAAFVVVVPFVFSGLKQAVPALFGTAVILVLLFEPGGLAGCWAKTRAYFRQWPFR
ncbi:MAG: branched-chain amino acid ABC transporter permease [Deltaproteobacteria bacterium]|nr:branched-chain amino acid ABC transporter permease [Deltaproteobacteria bacterium]